MIPCNTLQPNDLGAGEHPLAGSASPTTAAGFLTRLAAQIEQETGAKVDPQVLVDWLQKHGNEYPAIAPDGLLALLMQLMVAPAVAEQPVAQAPAASSVKDPAALLERLIVGAGKSVQFSGATDQQTVRKLLAVLHAGGSEPPLVEQTKADSSTPAVFQQLLQSVAAAVPGNPALPAADQRTGIASLPVTTPVTQADFGAAVGERLLWMIQHGVQHARLQLNPPGLGPLDITVSLHADQLSIALNAHHVLTRDTLVADAPRLRGLLADAGFGAVNVNVAHDQGRGDRPSSGATPHRFMPIDEGGAVETVERVPSAGTLRRGRSLVDHYA